MPTSRVARVRGEERYDNVSQARERIADKIDRSNKQQVLVTPDFLVTHKPLAATHVDGVRAQLDFVRSGYDGPVTVTKGPAAQPAAEGFRLYGSERLAGSHGATFSDLNHDGPLTVEVYDWRLRSLRLHLALASTDALAADLASSALMGLDADKAGYLRNCEEMGLGTGDLAQIEIVGNATLADCARPFRPRDTYQRQQRWMLPRTEEFLT